MEQTRFIYGILLQFHYSHTENFGQINTKPTFLYNLNGSRETSLLHCFVERNKKTDFPFITYTVYQCLPVSKTHQTVSGISRSSYHCHTHKENAWKTLPRQQGNPNLHFFVVDKHQNLHIKHLNGEDKSTRQTAKAFHFIKDDT